MVISVYSSTRGFLNRDDSQRHESIDENIFSRLSACAPASMFPSRLRIARMRPAASAAVLDKKTSTRRGSGRASTASGRAANAFVRSQRTIWQRCCNLMTIRRALTTDQTAGA